MADAPWRGDMYDSTGNRGFGQVDGKGYYTKQEYNDAKARKMYSQSQAQMAQVQQEVAKAAPLNQAAGQYNDIYKNTRDREQSSFRADQERLAGVLEDRARGKNLLSTELLRQGANRNVNQQLAMAASARPGQVGTAQRAAMQNVGAINTGLAGQQTIAGIQEQAANQAMLAGVLGQGRGQDLQFSGQQDQAMLGATGGAAGMAMGRLQNDTARYGIDTNSQTQRDLVKMQQPSDWEKFLGFGLGAGSAYLLGGR